MQPQNKNDWKPVAVVMGITTLIVALVLLFTTPSCAAFPNTTAQVEQIEAVVEAEMAEVAMAQEARDQAVANAQAEYGLGHLSQAELMAATEAANAMLMAEVQSAISQSLSQVHSTVDALHDEMSAMAGNAAGAPISGNPWIDLAIQLGGAVFVTNTYRNQKRKQRGEPTGTTPNFQMPSPNQPVGPGGFPTA